MNISIIITTHNRFNFLIETINSILKQSISINYNISIVVVVDEYDNFNINSLKKLFTNVIFIKGTGDWWFTKSLNEGCKHALNNLFADLLLTINDDVLFSDYYLKNLIEDYNSLGKDAILGSLSIDSQSKKFITFSGVKSFNKFKGSYINYVKYGTLFDSQKFNGIYKSIVLPTRGLLFSKTIFKLLGGFDEVFPQYASDYDFVLRASERKIDTFISYNAIIFENIKLTGVGSPRTSKNLLSFLKNMFFNKYSPTYIINTFRMNWRHRSKLLFPYYSITLSLGILKSFFKFQK